MEIHGLTEGDVDRVLAAAHLFDFPPKRDWTEVFLTREGHHLLFASAGGIDAGFVSGIEIAHPDKGVEMLLYELAVAEPYRRQGIGRALTLALLDIAREVGCRSMWVATEATNIAALATYRSANASGPEPGVTLEWRLTASSD
jgi:ribosomal protein S18 acetylase RimI-like enzyme